MVDVNDGLCSLRVCGSRGEITTKNTFLEPQKTLYNCFYKVSATFKDFSCVKLVRCPFNQH